MTFKRGSRTTAVIPTKSPVPETWMEADLVSCIGRNKHKDVQDILLGGDILDELSQQIATLKQEFETMYTQAK
ncbi:MAG: hypothetical protein M3Y72_16790 [Acidobacteriota bacterium]|nr:hypothetical protein [Acidobacteriota bacterium]